MKQTEMLKSVEGLTNGVGLHDNRSNVDKYDLSKGLNNVEARSSFFVCNHIPLSLFS